MVRTARSTEAKTAEAPVKGFPRTIDGLVLGTDGVWAVLGRGHEELDALFADADWSTVLICRRIDADGTVVLGRPDPDTDARLSNLMHRSEGGRG